MSTSTPDGAARVCVTDAKGGTGKTTVAIDVAGALNRGSHDVLFVDLDPQGNATEGCDAAPPTLFDVLTAPDSREDGEMLAWFDAVFAGDPVREVRKRVALQRAFSAGRSLFEHDDGVDTVGVFLDVADSLDEQFADATESEVMT